jgi:hypothetical protein
MSLSDECDKDISEVENEIGNGQAMTFYGNSANIDPNTCTHTHTAIPFYRRQLFANPFFF